jgi:hypothetical protein
MSKPPSPRYYALRAMRGQVRAVGEGGKGHQEAAGQGEERV